MTAVAEHPARPLPDRRRARRRAAWRRRGTLLASPRWIGLANYRYLFETDQRIWPAVRNTLWLIAVLVPLQVLFAFGVATMLARAKAGAGFFRTVFYLPALVPPVA